MSSIIIEQALERVRGLIVNQSRYVCADEVGVDFETFCEGQEKITDEESLSFLTDTPVICYDQMVELVEKIGLENLYDEDGWVDDVADYLVENQKHCLPLWKEIERRGMLD